MTNKEITNAYYGADQVEKIYLGSEVIWPAGSPPTPPTPPHDYSKDYLTIEVVGDPGYEGALTIRNNLVQYSLNGGPWTNNTILDYLHPGDIIRFRGDENSATGQGNFSGNTLQFKVYGNIESLEYGDNFSWYTSTKLDNSFRDCFRGCTGLTDASNLVLPATALTYNSYSYMFYSCTSLTTVPELPATTLSGGNSCYMYMFYGCTSLTTAPELPATTLTRNCYASMFSNCTSLTTAPELPATTLAISCYQSMFGRCTNLNYIKCLATDISASNCTGGWVQGVQTNSGTFVKPASTDWSGKTGTSGIPTGWTVIEE